MQDENDIEGGLAEGGIGGPGPADRANGIALLCAALRITAHTLAATAGNIGAVMPPQTHPRANAASERAACQAAALLEAADALHAAGGNEVAQLTDRLREAAEGFGIGPAFLGEVLRGAALTVSSDDGAARVSASEVAQEIAARLERG